MPYSDVTWSYKDAITSQKLNQMDDNAVFCAEHRLFGCTIDVTGTSTVQVGPGRMEIGGVWLTRDAALTALTADNNACWEEGANAENSATGWYIVAWNDSANSFNVKFRNSAPAYSDTLSGTANGPKIYDKTGTTWYRYIGYLYNNSDNALRKLRYHHNGWFYYANSAPWTTALVVTSWGTFTMNGIKTPMIKEALMYIDICQIGGGPSNRKWVYWRHAEDSSGYARLRNESADFDTHQTILPFACGSIQLRGNETPGATGVEFRVVAYKLDGRSM